MRERNGILHNGLRAVIVAVLLTAGQFVAAGQSGNHGKEFVQLVESGYYSSRYWQDSLMMVDPVGDAHLIRQLDTIPVKLLSYILHGTLPQAPAAQRAAMPKFKIGSSLPFDTDLLLNKCCGIMRNHFPDIFPTLGEEHRWSPEAENYLKYGFWHRLGRHASGEQSDFPCPLLGRSKLFICLACGWTARFCATGTEKALLDRIMAYPDRSVQLHNFFEESYILNGGNLYLTFLACENVLAGIPHRTERDSDPLQRKLAYIRNDSLELGDNYGAWYHFFGIALYGMFRPDWKSVTVADTESFGSFFLEGPDRQEDLINHYGAIFGQRLRNTLSDASWWLTSPDDTDYMKSK